MRVTPIIHTKSRLVNILLMLKCRKFSDHWALLTKDCRQCVKLEQTEKFYIIKKGIFSVVFPQKIPFSTSVTNAANVSVNLLVYSASKHLYLVPVEPKPPAPRTVSESSSESSNSAFRKGTIASCATLSAPSTV